MLCSPHGLLSVVCPLISITMLTTHSVFVLLCFTKPILGNRYGPGASSRASQGGRTHDWKSPKFFLNPVLPEITSAGSIWILTQHLNYVAGYTPLFLFKLTYNHYVDNQGLVPWWLCRLGGSSVVWAGPKLVLPHR